MRNTLRGLARRFRSGNHPGGRNGFIVDSVEGAVGAVHRAVHLDRRTVRACFQQRFSVERMTRDYVEIYRRFVARGDSAEGRGLTRCRLIRTAGSG